MVNGKVSTCLACVIPWVQTPTSQKQKRGKKAKVCLCAHSISISWEILKIYRYLIYEECCRVGANGVREIITFYKLPTCSDTCLWGWVSSNWSTSFWFTIQSLSLTHRGWSKTTKSSGPSVWVFTLLVTMHLSTDHRGCYENHGL